MKNWKVSLITVFCFLAIGSLALFSSCEQDPCMELSCKNGGVCSDGYCNCPVGFEGAECEIPASDRFVGTFVGNVRCKTTHGTPPQFIDTARFTLLEEPNRVRLDVGLGNTSLSFEGEARTPEAHFETVIDNEVTVHAYVTVDADLIYIYVESSDESIEYRQICRFQGKKIIEEN